MSKFMFGYFVLSAIFGGLVSAIGFPFTTWQFWALIAVFHGACFLCMLED